MSGTVKPVKKKSKKEGAAEAAQGVLKARVQEGVSGAKRRAAEVADSGSATGGLHPRQAKDICAPELKRMVPKTRGDVRVASVRVGGTGGGGDIDEIFGAAKKKSKAVTSEAGAESVRSRQDPTMEELDEEKALYTGRSSKASLPQVLHVF
jgi:hypothetical protein